MTFEEVKNVNKLNGKKFYLSHKPMFFHPFQCFSKIVQKKIVEILQTKSSIFETMTTETNNNNKKNVCTNCLQAIFRGNPSITNTTDGL